MINHNSFFKPDLFDSCSRIIAISGSVQDTFARLKHRSFNSILYPQWIDNIICPLPCTEGIKPVAQLLEPYSRIAPLTNLENKQDLPQNNFRKTNKNQSVPLFSKIRAEDKTDAFKVVKDGDSKTSLENILMRYTKEEEETTRQKSHEPKNQPCIFPDKSLEHRTVLKAKITPDIKSGKIRLGLPIPCADEIRPVARLLEPHSQIAPLTNLENKQDLPENNSLKTNKDQSAPLSSKISTEDKTDAFQVEKNKGSRTSLDNIFMRYTKEEEKTISQKSHDPKNQVDIFSDKRLEPGTTFKAKITPDLKSGKARVDLLTHKTAKTANGNNEDPLLALLINKNKSLFKGDRLPGQQGWGEQYHPTKLDHLKDDKQTAISRAQNYPLKDSFISNSSEKIFVGTSIHNNDITRIKHNRNKIEKVLEQFIQTTDACELQRDNPSHQTNKETTLRILNKHINNYFSNLFSPNDEKNLLFKADSSSLTSIHLTETGKNQDRDFQSKALPDIDKLHQDQIISEYFKDNLSSENTNLNHNILNTFIENISRKNPHDIRQQIELSGDLKGYTENDKQPGVETALLNHISAKYFQSASSRKPDIGVESAEKETAASNIAKIIHNEPVNSIHNAIVKTEEMSIERSTDTNKDLVLSEKINQILIDQARRFGIDI